MNFTPQFGPLLTEGGVIFRLWAPAAHRVRLVLDRKLVMKRTADWFAPEIPRATVGGRGGKANVEGSTDKEVAPAK